MVKEKDILLVGSIGIGYSKDTIIESENITFNGAVAYLMTYLTRQGYNVDYVDCIETGYGDIIKKLNQNTYKLIGISTSLCNNMQSVMKLIYESRKRVCTSINMSQAISVNTCFYQRI